jgi:hypothetical protein
MGMESMKIEEEWLVIVPSVQPAQHRRVDPFGAVIQCHLTVGSVVLFERKEVDVLKTPGEAE